MAKKMTVDDYLAAQEARKVSFGLVEKPSNSGPALAIAAVLVVMIVGALGVRVISNISAEKVGILMWNSWQIGALGLALFAAMIAIIAIVDHLTNGKIGFNADAVDRWETVKATVRKDWRLLKRLWAARGKVLRYLTHKERRPLWRVHCWISRHWELYDKWAKQWNAEAIHWGVLYVVSVVTMVAADLTYEGQRHFAPVETARTHDSTVLTTDAELDAALDKETCRGIVVENGALKLAVAKSNLGKFVAVATPAIGSGSLGVMDASSPDNVWFGDSGSNVYQWDGMKLIVHENVTAPASVAAICTYGPKDTFVFDGKGRTFRFSGQWATEAPIPQGDPITCVGKGRTSDEMVVGTTAQAWHLRDQKWEAEREIAGVTAVSVSTPWTWASVAGMYTCRRDCSGRWEQVLTTCWPKVHVAGEDIWMYGNSSTANCMTGSTTTSIDIPLGTVRSMSGDAQSIYAISDKQVAHWDGTSWKLVPQIELEPDESLVGVQAFSSGAVVLSTKRLYRLEGVEVAYRSSATAIMRVTPREGQVNRWIGASHTAITIDGTSVKLSYSNDGKDWRSDISDVTSSETLQVKVELVTNNPRVSLPVVTSVQIDSVPEVQLEK